MDKEKKLQDLKDAKIRLQNFEVCECEVYSRIVGYFRPTKQWNPGKQSEWADRTMYVPGEYN